MFYPVVDVDVIVSISISLCLQLKLAIFNDDIIDITDIVSI